MPKLSLLIRVSFCFLFLLLPLTHMDEWFYDLYFVLRGHQTPSPAIVLVEVEDSKLQASFPLSYWSRLRGTEHSGLTQGAIWHSHLYESLLKAIQKNNPQLTAFTSFYGSVDNPEAGPHLSEDVLFSSWINQEEELVPPIPWLTIQNNYGFGNITPDSDHKVRRGNLTHKKQPSLALRISNRLRGESTERNLEQPLWIDFRGPAGTYPTYDANKILSGEVPPDRFKNKIVLVGRTSRNTPKTDTPFGPMSKLEIQANIVDSLIGKHDIQHLPLWVHRVMGTSVILASVFIVLSLPLKAAWVSLLALALTLFVSNFCLFAIFKIWIGISNAIVCIVGTHLLMMGYKLGRQEEQQRLIQQESEHLKEMDQFKNNFISLFSHDLKTPIAKIKAITERLLSENTKMVPAVEQGLNAIQETNSELSRSISDILKVTRMETMSMEPSKDVMDLNRLVEEAVARNKFLADEKKLSISMDLEPLFSMEGDTQLIGEVITNLLENAIKYSPHERKIVVGTQESEDRVYVSVTDQGPGIAKEEIPRVTGKFYRGKKVEESTKGSGLGLYLAKYFVEMHQGALEIKSELGKGTQVSFWLPLPS